MTTALETAFPLGSNYVTATVRAKLAEAMIGVFSTPNLSAEDFSIQPYRALAIYGSDGDLEFYAYDSGDTTTADDGGVSCIVVSGRRYKKRIDVIVRDSALSATTDAQPVSPSLGDTYILTAAPSGDDWASEAKAVATYTARGWIFRDPFVGMTVYVEDEDAFYHYDSGGDWVLGMGVNALADGSVTPVKLFHPFALLKVVDQRNAPPGGTPTDGTMYQVGTSATDDFATHENEIARWNASGSGAWQFIEPEEGDTIYRLDIKRPYSFRSGAWEPTIPASGVQQIKRRELSSVAFNNVTGTIARDTGIDFTSELGKYLRISLINLSFSTTGNANCTHVLRLYADTSTGPILTIATHNDIGGGGATYTADIRQVIYAVPDGSSHNYNLGVVRTSGSGTTYDFTVSCDMLIEEIVIL